ncbi:Uncharacterised protein [Mycobacteroides abscessus subsp. bolletii]|uniref:hypothetical protein n=1 Tax=Mycobacteroides abscessus TaxID=36809 RepID=UPI0009A77505|nr:hypothetical protein [Mycobacteroides abscessus]SLD51579.1 Uncharacterised protein [Mycobacteroides abscessus subsp. bolletii]
MKYRVLKPCAFTQDGQAVHHTQAGAVVAPDDELMAAALVAAGKLEAVDEPEPVSAPAEAPKPAPAKAAARNRSGSDENGSASQDG